MSIGLTTTLPPSSARASNARPITMKAYLPLYLYAVSLASLLTVTGILWDISWHRSIGRDKFLSPPHILIYLGAIFAGLFSGIQVIWNSIRPTETVKASTVRVWGVFYSSLGALFCIWGAIAMLTSAPFDDWWHSAYGLDVTILSPPHSLLGLGMLFLQFGACVGVSKYLNTGDTVGKYLFRILLIVSAASLLTMIYTLGTQFLHTRGMRGGQFYIIAAATTLLFLPVFGRALRMKWGMMAVALGYFFIAALSNWILQIFPAEPKLGPILTHTTHFQPGNFPMLVFIPALLMDWISRSWKGSEWIKALLLSVCFVLGMLIIEYPLSGWLIESPYARNWFFGADSWYFGDPPDWPYRYKIHPFLLSTPGSLAIDVLIAIAIGTLAARLSLRWGQWIQLVKR
ncbi:MAG: hypothetical protein J0H07_16120 [Sphingobacteriales bacterium]|nr:hypothetical protein [Sphingobacteriales bacterium]